MKKELKLFTIIYIIIILLAIIAINIGCNPVKKVLRNPAMYERVKNRVILNGECVNDTVIVSKSDTLVTFDTLYSLDFKTDTFNIDREIIKVKTVVKTVSIRDTLTKVVTDNSRIDLLQKQLQAKDGQITQLNQITTNAKDSAANERKRANKWRFRFWLLVAVIGLILFRNPLLKLATKIISPIKLPI